MTARRSRPNRVQGVQQLAIQLTTETDSTAGTQNHSDTRRFEVISDSTKSQLQPAEVPSCLTTTNG